MYNHQGYFRDSKMRPAFEKNFEILPKLIENLLRSKPPFQRLVEHIAYQKNLTDKLIWKNHEAFFQYIKNDATFDELYDAGAYLPYYAHWILSTWHPETQPQLLKKVLAIGTSRALDLFENAALTLRAQNMTSLKEWWINLYDARFVYLCVGAVCQKITTTVAERPDYGYRLDKSIRLTEKELYNLCGFDHPLLIQDRKIIKPTDSISNKIIYYMEKYRWGVSLYTTHLTCRHPVDVSGIKLSKNEYRNINITYDKTISYALKYFEAIKEKSAREALRDLYHGNLNKYLSRRVRERLKNEPAKDRAKKRGGLSDLEKGKLIKQYRQKRNLSQEELAEKSGKSVKFIDRLEKGKIKFYRRTVFIITEVLKMDIRPLISFPQEIRYIENIKYPSVKIDEFKKLSDAIAFKEIMGLIRSKFREHSSEYKYLEYRTKYPDDPEEVVAQELNMTSRGLRKVVERIKKRAQEDDIDVSITRDFGLYI
jgi:transcriptional regulator with XRE-family HTH domain